MKKLIQFATDIPIASAVIVVGVLLLAYYLIWGRKKNVSVASSTSTALGTGTSTGMSQRVSNGGVPSERLTVINERLKGGGVPSGARVGTGGRGGTR